MSLIVILPPVVFLVFALMLASLEQLGLIHSNIWSPILIVDNDIKRILKIFFKNFTPDETNHSVKFYHSCYFKYLCSRCALKQYLKDEDVIAHKWFSITTRCIESRPFSYNLLHLTALDA